MFEYKLLPEVKLPKLEGTEGRLYQLPDGQWVPSVTTLLSGLPNPTLEAWKERVGTEKAIEEKNKGSARGELLHNACEHYLRYGNLPDHTPMYTKYSFRTIRKLLDENVSNIYGIEQTLYSKRLHVAGKSDLIADWKNKTSIVDFKGSNWPKAPEDILAYWLQVTLYSLMLQELFGLKAEKLVIIMSVDLDKMVKPLVWEKDRTEFLPQLQEFMLSETNYLRKTKIRGEERNKGCG